MDTTSTYAYGAGAAIAVNGGRMIPRIVSLSCGFLCVLLAALYAAEGDVLWTALCIVFAAVNFWAAKLADD